jgi:hypothetical protein
VAAGNIRLQLCGVIGHCTSDNEAVSKRIKYASMKSRLLVPLLSILLLLPAAGALAQDRRHDLPPEERREIRKQMREHWQQQNLAPRPDNDARPAHWRDLPPDERRRLRDEMREQNERDDKRSKRRWRED